MMIEGEIKKQKQEKAQTSKLENYTKRMLLLDNENKALEEAK